ncbi:WcaI family glycosyltransferase [Sphingopyxis sp. 2PD]|uniref:WcaI family glycosyltransferase n=1 Tax=Sphingopyxis sp. 2PD TaxID=2502196 RepID=UPI0010F5BCDD|nr:WcaI family glycosyltransferase [Sphingopyxis sp. 2PD]
MKFLVVGLNYSPEPTGSAPYSADYCETLARGGHEVRMVCAAPYYPHWRTFDGYRGLRWPRRLENGVLVWRCPIYVPSRASGAARIAFYISFFLSSFIPVLWSAMRMRPNVIVNMAPTLISAPSGLLAAKLCGARTQVHVQDFEVEAGFATDQLASGGRLARWAMGFSNWAIRAHDFATSISPAMVKRLVHIRASDTDCYELRNWADIANIVPQENSKFRKLWDVHTRHVALYSGSIARKQGLDMLIETARLLRDRQDLTFVICGNGPFRAQLIEMASGLPNIQFHDLQPREDLGELLNLATIHLLPQKRDAADLVLPSKLTNMLASGRPVIAGADAGTGLADEIADCGIAVEPENSDAMAHALVSLLDDSKNYARLALKARQRAESVWARQPILDRYLAWIGHRLA